MISREMMGYFAENYPRDYPEPESVVKALRLKKHVVEIPVEMKERKNGKSSISFVRAMYYVVKVSLAMCLVDGRR